MRSPSILHARRNTADRGGASARSPRSRPSSRRFCRLPALLLSCCCLILAACQSAPQSALLLKQPPTGLAAAQRIDQVPFFPQERYHCGPAALATVLGASGVTITPEALVSRVFVPGREGSFQTEMMAAARSHGRLVYELEPTLRALIEELAAGNPVLVLQNLGLDRLPQWHFAVARGFDLEQGRLILNSGLIENYEVALPVFERTWARAGHWAVTVTAVDRLPATADADGLLKSLDALQQSFPQFPLLSEAFHTALQRWPEDPGLLLGQGNLLLGEARLEAAASSYRRLLVIHPDYAPAHNNLAHAYLELGSLDLAREHALRALATGDRFASTYASTLEEIEDASRASRHPD